MKKKKLKKGAKIVVIVIFILLLVGVPCSFLLYYKYHGLSSELTIKLKGSKNVTIEVGGEYKEAGATAKYKDIDISKDVKVVGKINEKKLGNYTLKYKIKYKKISKEVVRKIKIIDKISPVITLEGDEINIIVGNEFNDPGYKATDNYDGDITDKVVVDSGIDINTIGEYTVTYKVEDSSKNSVEITRKVNVIAKPRADQKIAVLNYHFFFDPDLGEGCNESICEKVSDFRSHLDYFRDNGYKTLTMKEFRDWMYGVTELPEKSVLITVDDGALGTGTHNGNKLIPLLEEYKMHATLFLITGWWSIDNYRSEYLDVESHTNDMHTGGLCSAMRGAKILCSSDEYVLEDLRKSIEITGSKTSFCFPFYAYSDHAIELVKQAGFEIAFVGGSRKASRNDDKYKIPRFPIQTDTSLQEIINMVS